jgi:hypothetical protein
MPVRSISSPGRSAASRLGEVHGERGPGTSAGARPFFSVAAAALYVSAEALNPKGTDQVIASMATAFTVLPIAAAASAHMTQQGAYDTTSSRAVPGDNL